MISDERRHFISASRQIIHVIDPFAGPTKEALHPHFQSIVFGRNHMRIWHELRCKIMKLISGSACPMEGENQGCIPLTHGFLVPV